MQLLHQPSSVWVRDPEYPDDDGIPVSDNTLQTDWIMLLKCGLELQFQKQDVFVAANLLWYPRRKLPGETQAPRMAPDVMVVFGRANGYRGSYKQWDEDNIGVHVVFEIFSPDNTKRELEAKRRFYEEFGVEEYYLIHPKSPCKLQAWHRVDGEFQPIEDVYAWQSPRLGIYFTNIRGHLKVFDQDDEEFVLPVKIVEKERKQMREAKRAAAKERERAEKERKRAEQQQRRAEHASRENEKLAAKLRELGIDPETI